MRMIVSGVLAATLCLSGPPAAQSANARTSVVKAPAGSVNLYRDRFGAPHLYAAREEDGYFGLGYAMGEDRLLGVLLFYSALQGRLAEAFGPGPLGDKSGAPGGAGFVADTVASDLDMLQARHLVDARANFPSLSPQMQKDMSAFTAGLQRYMDEHPDKVPTWAPKLEPALPLAASGFVNLSAEPQAPGRCGSKADALVQGATPMRGSNVWALSAARTRDGAAMFSSDSHSEIQLFGTFFYGARIDAGSLDAWMLDITGLPMGLKGHSRYFAWGWSEGPRRPADCLTVPIDPTDPARYVVDGVSQPFVSEPYRILVKGGQALEGRFDYTRHNGVLSPVVRRSGEQAFVISNTYMGRAGLAQDAYRQMLSAEDWTGMQAALDRLELYPANLIMAGADGSISYVRPGRVPVRPDGATGLETLDGSTSATAWRGVHPLASLVQLHNPDAGFLTNENVSPDMMFSAPALDPKAFPPDFAFEPGQTGSRQRRAIRLLEGQKIFSFADGLEVVADTVIPGWEPWVAALRSIHSASVVRGERAAFQRRLEAFDGAYSPSSRTAVAMALLREETRKGPLGLEIETALATGASLNDAQKAALTAAEDRAYAAWQAAGRPERFGDLFRIGRGGVSEPGRGFTQFKIKGDTTGVSDFGSLWAAIYAAPEADTRRYSYSETRWPFLVQLTRPIRSYSLAVHGVSDDPLSPHYSDQAHFVAKAQLHSNYFEAEDLAKNLESARTLKVAP